MAFIELQFPVQGTSLPTDHGYALYAALCRLAPAIHATDCLVLVGSIGGEYAGEGQLRIDRDRSRLPIRLPAEQIPSLLPLAGKVLDVSGHRLRLGVPNVRTLIPAPSLMARLVILKASTPRTNPADKDSRNQQATKRYLDPAPFLDGCRRQLDELGIPGDIGIPLVPTGPHAGKPRRHILRIKDKTIAGFSLQITGLTAEESIALQEHGLGGRKKMGCGFFVPLLPRMQ